MVFTINSVIVGLVLLCVCTAEEENHDHSVQTVDPYHETLHFLGISNENEFTIERLNFLVEEYFELLHCHVHDHGHDDADDDHEESCNKTLCLNTESLVLATDSSFNQTISEELFAKISTSLLYLATNLTSYCHSHVNATSDDVIRFKEKLTTLYSGGVSTGTFQLGHVQEMLEVLHFLHEHETHEEHEEEEGHEEHEGEHNEEDPDHEEHEEHAHAELIADKCLGADILFDQLGFDVHQPVEAGHLDDISSLIVYHIVTGSHVSRSCRKLPRADFFPHNVYAILDAQNDTLTPEGLEALRKRLGLESSLTDEHEGHDHARRRRSAVDVEAILEPATWKNRCYTGEELLSVHGIPVSGIPIHQFRDICPSLIQQQLSQACAVEEATVESQSGPSDAERYGWGSLATFIICLGSIAGVIVIPCASKSVYRGIMAVFMGMAVGTLVADALLHLLPMALGIHGHGDGDHADHDHGVTIEPFVVYSLVVCGGIYIFYLFEKVMHLMKGKRHSHSHDLDCMAESHDTEISNVGTDTDYSSTKSPNSFDNLAVIKDVNGSPLQIGAITKAPENKSKQTHKKSVLTPLAIMVLFGDGIHNFADGLAVGAAFSSSISLGVSTSIAVFCHEVPHELGDFAVLLNSGLSMCRALAFNFLSSLLAMVGLYVGLVISTHEETRIWIVAITAGMFLYIALVDLMPQLLVVDKDKPVLVFFLHNVGIMIGAGAMLLLAVFEEHIKI